LLELIEQPEPQPGVGEVLCEVLASPISPLDRLSVRGLDPLHEKGEIPGAQGVALVVELGEGVRKPEVGTVVLLPLRVGAWRERLVVAARELISLSAHRDPVSACTLRIEALTAAALIAELEPGECFVHSPGAGSVGRYLTVLARARGLRSVALVGSREPIADLWGLGADHVLVREPGLSERLDDLGLPQARLAFDGSGGSVSQLLATCLAPDGELVVYGATSRLPIFVSLEQLTTRGIRMRGFSLPRWSAEVGPERVTSELEALVRMDLREHVVGRFTLEQWPEAIEQAERVGARGRVVFTPGMVLDPPV
jgi:mitochondrial enoyl-[acyl-carrier protein] reductase / trans-2-enoyl-CoA reductase